MLLLLIEGNEQPSEPADEVKLLGELELKLSGNLPKGSPIEVTFLVEAAGVYVKAVDLTNGDQVETKIAMKSIENLNPDIPPVVVAGE